MLEWTFWGISLGGFLKFWGVSIVISWVLMVIEVYLEPENDDGYEWERVKGSSESVKVKTRLTKEEARAQLIFILVPAINLAVSIWAVISAFFNRFWKVDLRWLFLVFPRKEKKQEQSNQDAYY